MVTNADLTIYNYWYNPETKKREYRGTKIIGIHWYTEQKTAATDKGLVSANLYKIRIPDHATIQDGRTYIDSNDYRFLGTEKVLNHWTIENEDIFIKGLVSDNVEKLSDLTVKFSCAGKINSYSDNRFGCNPHFRIGGA